MDRRSWLWRRKSSDKSPGETESSGSGSGSISSPSERFSDEQQAYSNQNIQSPEVTSKAISHDEDANGGVKILSEKLSDALANVSVKDDLAKQHAKVAEEAVTGWEKAEKEVITFKQQLEIATKKNSSLEDRVVHLDGALKECLRQLRLVREEQDQKIQEAISRKSHDTESRKSEVESQLSNLGVQLEIANAKAEAAASSESDLRHRLDSLTKENASLQLQLHSQLEDLEIRILERDLSTKTAETASKHHLESIKKVAKLEGECRRLKTIASKATSFNEQKLFIASPSNAESLTDSQSDRGERSIDSGPSHSDTWASALIAELDHIKIEKAPAKDPKANSTEINLMDDFLEMERLASLPLRENRSNSLGSVISVDKLNEIGDASLRTELEAMMKRTVELEEKAKILEKEKLELGLTLTQCQEQVKKSEARSMQLQVKLNECLNQLKISQAQLTDANKKLGMLQAELDLANELRQAIELELEDANVSKEEAESQLKVIEDESKILLSKVGSFESEAEKERSLYADASAKCRALEEEISRMKQELDSKNSQLASIHDSKEAVELKLQSTNTKKETAESELVATQSEVKSLLAKISSLENEAEKERHVSLEAITKCRELEDDLSRIKHEAETWQSQLASVNGSKEAVELELKMTKARRQEIELRLEAAHDEAKTLLAKVGSLEHEAEKERALSSEFAAKCRTLEIELSKTKIKADLRLVPLSKEELKIQQEKELATAAGKLAECQKTIASLGQQLKSLVTFDDLFLDSDNPTEISEKESQLLQTGDESPCGSKLVVESDSDSLASKTIKDDKDGSSLSSSNVDKNQKNGFGKLFFQTMGSMRSQNL